MRRFAALPLLALLAPAAAAQQNRFEPNQTRRTAARVTPGDHKGLFCNEEDWYAVEVGEGQRLEAQIGFRHAEGDLELEVQDARGRTLGWSRGQKDEEVLAFTPPTHGTVFVRVHNASAAYDLHLGVEAGGQEGSATDRAVAATCWGADWYPVEVPAGQQVRAELTFRHTEGDLDLQLFGPDGQELAASSGQGDREEARWTAREATTVLVQVRHVHRARSAYALRLSVGSAALADVARVLRVDRPDGAGKDLLELRGGDVLHGTVLNESFRIVTSYTELDLPASRIAGIDLERRQGDIEAIVTVDEDRFSGFLRTESLRVKLPSLAEPIEIRRERFVRVIFGRRGGERTERPADAHRLVLRNNDEFTGRVRGSGWTVDLGFASLPVGLAEVESIAFEEGGVVSLVRPDRTVLRGRLETESIEVDLLVGAEAKPVRLHPDRLALLRRGQAGAGTLGPAELLQVISQLAPNAPRPLVRELTDEGGATAERVSQLRPHVTVRDDGCAPLDRHVQAVADKTLQYAWLQVLLRVDKRLRDRFVRLIGEDHEERRLRVGAAQSLVDLATAGGPTQPIETACTNGQPGSDIIMGIIVATNDDTLMQRIMPIVRRGWRGGRAEAGTPADKEALLAQLPRLLGER